jgi:hypothetical protein
LRAKGNYGWSEREGFFQVDHSDQNILLPFPPDDDMLGYVYPAAQYDHDEGRAIVDDLMSGSPALIEELTLFYADEERDILGTRRGDLRFGVNEAGEI